MPAIRKLSLLPQFIALEQQTQVLQIIPGKCIHSQILIRTVFSSNMLHNSNALRSPIIIRIGFNSSNMLHNSNSLHSPITIRTVFNNSNVLHNSNTMRRSNNMVHNSNSMLHNRNAMLILSMVENRIKSSIVKKRFFLK